MLSSPLERKKISETYLTSSAIECTVLVMKKSRHIAAAALLLLSFGLGNGAKVEAKTLTTFTETATSQGAN